MNRSLVSTAVALATLVSVAGCGGSSSGPQVSAHDADAAVERAAGIQLAARAVPADAKDEGLVAASSNVASVAADKQIVFVFTLKDAKTVGKLRDQLKSSVPGTSVKVITNANVVVVYGATGNDHAAAVKSAVDALA